MSNVERENSSSESSPHPQDASSSRSEPSQTPPDVPAPSFIEASVGGLLAGSVVLADTVFGPYRGSITKMPPSKEEEEEETDSTVLKIQDSAGQEYVIDVDNAERERPWWAGIKQATDHRQANTALFSHNGALYLKILKQIPKSKELQMIVTTPKDGPHTTDGDATDIRSTPTNGTTPVTTPPSHPTSSSLLEGPPFKCNFCCIEFRNPSNLDAHRVYYCPGTATEPLPASRRRTTVTSQSTITTTPATKSTPAQNTKRLEASAKNVVTMETRQTYVCQLCQSSFESKSNCESHMLLLHCDESANLCKFCNFISGDRKGLCQHVFSHVRRTAEEMSKCLGDGGEQVQNLALKMVKGVLADYGDEKENRYDTITASISGTGNNPQNDHAQSVSSPCFRHVVSSPSDRSNHSVSNLSTPETTPSLAKEDRCSSAILIKAESPNLHHVAVKLNREPADEDILSCPHCDFVTSRESVLLKHVTHHNNLRKKTHSRTSSADIEGQKVDERDGISNHSDTKCHQCNIVFMSKKNYAAHKRYYCASRHTKSTSPPAMHDLDLSREMPLPDVIKNTNTTTKDQIERNIIKKPLNGPAKLQEPCSSKIVSPRCSPFEVDEDNSSRNSSLHRTSRVNMTPPIPSTCPPTTRSTPDDQLYDRPLRMIHLDGSKPQFLPPGTVLQGPQLVLVTPIVIPQSIGNTADFEAKLKIPVVTSSKTDQPLDLSTKTKTPPLSDLSRSDNHNITSSSGLSSQVSNVQLFERQANRCEECEISFSKKESLVVHKQYYCASRHMFTPRGLVRTKQYGASKLPAFPKSKTQNKSASPESLASRSPISDVEVGYSETHNSEMKPKITNCSNRSPICPASSTVSVNTNAKRTDHIVPYTSPSRCSNSSTTDTPTDTPTKFANTNNRDNFNHHQSWSRTHKLKRAASDESTDSDRERSLPPIKRKRNLMLHVNGVIPSTMTSTNGQLTNGVIIKQEPKDLESVTNSYACSCSKPIGTLEHPTTQSQHPAQNTPRSSPPSPKPASTILQTETMIKQEPHDGIPTINGHSVESAESPEPHHAINKSHPVTESFQQAPIIHSENRNLSSRPSLIRHPITSVTPLTIPVYRHSSSRQASHARHMTVSSYLNTGTSRPLLRGVKPTVKHCRNCNISFSSLSTFIAHKKYYCASHHQAKNVAT